MIYVGVVLVLRRCSIVIHTSYFYVYFSQYWLFVRSVWDGRACLTLLFPITYLYLYQSNTTLPYLYILMTQHDWSRQR